MSLTIEEKRKNVLSFCNDTSCLKCPLTGTDWIDHYSEPNACLSIETCPEEDLDKAISIIEKYEFDQNNNVPIEPFNDAVNHPSHYNDGKIEVIKYIEDKGLARGFCLGNAIKYISRAGKKDPTKEIEDLEKALFYINYFIDYLKRGG